MSDAGTSPAVSRDEGDQTPERRLPRVRYGAAAVPGATPPYDRVAYRIFHPAVFTGSPQERQTGALPADRTLAPWPVLIMLGGINVNPDGYRWLATRLTELGVATVLFHHVAEITPGDVGLSPGLDLGALTPQAWLTRPSATVVGPVLDALALENTAGPLLGLLDLDRILLGGHSAGGTVALLNANPSWFPGIVGAISYAGHSMPAALLGHPTGTVLSVGTEVPALVIGGDNDQVIAASAVRYAAPPAVGTDDSTASTIATPHDPIRATFERGTTAAGSALVTIGTGTHLTFCDPVDPTSARGFLEAPDPDGDANRELIASVIEGFINDVCSLGRSIPSLALAASSPMVSEFRQW